jgi:acetyl-CoA acetyltransferase
MLLKRRGLRLLTTLHDRLAEVGTPGARGLATLCVSGGQGVSVLARWLEL